MYSPSRLKEHYKLGLFAILEEYHEIEIIYDYLMIGELP